MKFIFLIAASLFLISEVYAILPLTKSLHDKVDFCNFCASVKPPEPNFIKANKAKGNEGSECNPEDLDLSCKDKKTGQKKGFNIHLTFDDGPSQAGTRKVLLALKENKVTGTFFVLGKKLDKASFKEQTDDGVPWSTIVEDNFSILGEIKEGGHHIASHTYDHINHSNPKNQSILRTNIATPFADPKLNKYFDVPPFLRLPGGSCWYGPKCKGEQCLMVMNLITEKHNATHVGWSVDPHDYENLPQPNGKILPALDSMTDQICEEEGGIVLLHDVQPTTYNNLDCMIKELKKAGHNLVDINDPGFKGKKYLGKFPLLTAKEPCKPTDAAPVCDTIKEIKTKMEQE